MESWIVWGCPTCFVGLSNPCPIHYKEIDMPQESKQEAGKKEESVVSNSGFFDVVLRNRLELIQAVLGKKGHEYVRGGDRFSNFKHAGQYQKISPEAALIGMRAKHEISLLDLVNDLDAGKLPSVALLEEKVGDNINYLILLEGMVKERIQNHQTDKIIEDYYDSVSDSTAFIH